MSMKINFQKNNDSLKNVVKLVGNTGRKAADVMKDSVQTISSTAQKVSVSVQAKNREDRLKKFSPLFPDEYRGADFNIPNLIRIVDDAERKGIDVCEGAIGWTSKEKDVEVLHLYDEAITFSGLQFLPAAVCDTIYYVDPYNRNRYFSVDSYFPYIQQSKLAELQHIAFCLGAKHYRVELEEATNEKSSSKKSATVKGSQYGNGHAESELDKKSSAQSKSLAEQHLTGSQNPVKPTLYWFAHDPNITELVNMRFSGERGQAMTTLSIELKSSSSSIMSANTAAKIDAAVGNLGASSAFKSEVEKEHSCRMIFKLEF